MGAAHACARHTDSTVVCWGKNDASQLGDGTTTDRLRPTEVVGLSDVRELYVGDFHNCVLRVGGDVMCWGRGERGQNGDGELENRARPVSVGGVSDAEVLTTGHHNTCALVLGRTVMCWGKNQFGEQGLGYVIPYNSPMASVARTVPLTDVASVEGGGRHICWVLVDGQVLCAGSNEHGQLGDGTTTDRYDPTPVI